MTFDSTIKYNGQLFTPDHEAKGVKIGDIIRATGWFAKYDNDQPKLATIVQRVNEMRGEAVRIDSSFGSFECTKCCVLRLINAADLEVARATLAESESLFAAGLRPSLGQNRGKTINTDFQREAAQHSIDSQRQLVADMAAQVG